MNRFYSLRNILLSIFFFSFFLPLTVMILTIPSSFKKQFQEETDQLIYNNLDLFSENLNSYLQELQKLASYPLFKKDVINVVQSRGEEGDGDNISQQEIENLFNVIIPDYLRISRKDILSIVIHYGEKTLYSNRNSNVSLEEKYNFKEQEWFRETVKGGDQIQYIGSHRPEYFSHSDTLSVFSVARTITHPYNSDILGVVIADADTAVFEEMLKNFKSTVGSVTVLLDGKNNILFSSRGIGQEVLERLKRNEEKITIGREMYSANYSLLSPSKWKVIILLSQTEMQHTILLIYLKVILISLACFLISMICYNFFAKRFITSPVNKMMKIMKEVETGNLKPRSIPNSINEINSMGQSLNDMIRQLNNHINTEYKLVLQQKNAEYRALQSQIQPHFIYNVLNGFFALNRLGRREVLEKSIMDLTGMLRYSLSTIEKTTIHEVLSFIDKYCALQKLRFEERFCYEISSDETVDEAVIPRLLIQPLVENAVKHGVEPLIRKCTVQIRVDESAAGDNRYLRILVQDNGSGFDMTKVHQESIGILNIKERLALISEQSSLDISSFPGKGTIVVILIPRECV